MSHFLDAEIIGLAGKSEPTRISFDRHVNIIYGLNGSGKTSLLRILHAAMNMDGSQLNDVPFDEATVRVHSISFDMDFTLHFKKSPAPERARTAIPSQVGQLGQSGFLPHAYQITYPQDYDTLATPGLVHFGFDNAVDIYSTKPWRSAKWTMTPDRPDKAPVGFQNFYLPTSRLHVGVGNGVTQTQTGQALTEELLDRYFAEVISKLWGDYTSAVVREVRDAQEKGLANILRGVLAGPVPARAGKASETDLEKGYESAKKFLERQGTPSALGSFDDFKRRFPGDKSLQNVVNDIFQIEQAIDKAVMPQQHLQDLVRKMYSGNKTISFTDKSITVANLSGTKIGLGSLSSGEKHLIQLFVAALLAQQSSILIDEPELSIHVDWQRELVAAFQTLNPQAQFILATHSPEVMSEVSDDRIFAL